MTIKNPLPFALRQTVEFPQLVSLPSPLPLEPQAYLAGVEFPFVIRTTPEMFKNLLSAMQIGAELEYPDVSVEMLMIMSAPLDRPVSICDLVLDCILSDDSIISALQTMSQSGIPPSVNANTQIENGVSSDRELTAGNNNDEIYGNARSIWQYINAVNVDVLEILAASSNSVGAVSDAVSSIPILSQAPIDEILEFLADFADNALEQYNASLTIELEQRIICDIFCLMLDGSVSLDTLFEYFSSRMSSPITAQATARVLIQTITSSNVGAFVIYAASSLQLASAILGSRYIGLDLTRDYNLYIASGEPDDDWETLCDECPQPWCVEFDFVASASNWIAFVQGGFTRAQYVQDVGWIRGTGAGGIDEISIQFVFSSSATITLVEVEQLTDFEGIERMYVGSDTVQGCDAANTSDLYVCSAQFVDDNIVVSAYRTDGIAYDGTLKRVLVEGTGANPFGENGIEC